MVKRFFLSLMVFSFCICLSSNAEISTISTQEVKTKEPVTAKIILEQQSIQPGVPFTVGLELSLEDEWHTYWKNPGDAGHPPSISWNLPEGYTVSGVQWPTPKKFSLMDSVGFGYDGQILFLAEITPPDNAQKKATIGADIDWVICNDSTCLPGDVSVTTSVPVTHESPTEDPVGKRKILEGKKTLPRFLKAASAYRKDDLITLTLTAGKPAEEVIFFPENHLQIDHSVEPVLTKIKGEQEAYKIILKEGEETKQHLKGVVVLKTEENSPDLSYKIDLSLKHSEKNTIAMGDDGASESITRFPSQEKGGLLFWICGAFLGGLILNLMPCVFPVISFKILSFVKLAGKSRQMIFKHVLAFSSGVLFSFWLLSGTLLILKSYGHAVGWGFQLQEPFFVALMASIMLIFGLSMFGVFEFGAGFASIAGQREAKKHSHGLSGSFFSGIFATAVATPCTGPLMAPALGFAATQPPLSSMLIFTSLGLGMASPYLFLGAFPQLLKFMPKPGNWMVIFKEMMGFVMFASVIWLFWVFTSQVKSPEAIPLLLAAFFLMAIACWIFGRWGTPIKKKRVRVFSYVVSLSLLACSVFILNIASTNTPSVSRWETFSPEKVAELRAQGVPVFIDFTANWCLTCQVNHRVLQSESVEKKFEEAGVVRMLADWTSKDPVIAKEMEKYGRNSVPLYLLYGKNSEETAEVLPQLLTPGTVIDYLDRL